MNKKQSDSKTIGGRLHDISIVAKKYFHYEGDINTFWKRYLYICNKYELAQIKRGCYRLVIKDDNFVPISKLNRFMSTYEQQVFFETHSIALKNIEVCSACGKLPTGAKKTDKKCCLKYDCHDKTKRKVAFDVDLVRDYTVPYDLSL